MKVWCVVDPNRSYVLWCVLASCVAVKDNLLEAGCNRLVSSTDSGCIEVVPSREFGTLVGSRFRQKVDGGLG